MSGIVRDGLAIRNGARAVAALTTFSSAPASGDVTHTILGGLGIGGRVEMDRGFLCKGSPGTLDGGNQALRGVAEGVNQAQPPICGALWKLL